jgi:hypothetical protein
MLSEGPPEQTDIGKEVGLSTTSKLFKAARVSASARAVSQGKVPRRAKNVAVGRTLGRAGFWRALWK